MRRIGLPVHLSAIALLMLATLATAGAAGNNDADPPRRVQLYGTLDVVQLDEFDSGRTSRQHRLIDAASGRVFELDFGSSVPPGHLRTGMQVVARGLARGNRLDVGSNPDDGVDAPAEAAEATTGTRQVVVLVADFADGAVGCSDASIESLMWTGAQSVDGLYQASSYGQLSLPSDTDNDNQPDLFRVSIANSVSESCDAYGWAAAAESAATAAGVDLGLYQHRVIVLPSDVSCGWAGLGNVGCGSYCRAWVKTCHLPDVYAHEIGHNLYMAHASTDPDNDGQIDCEYCDRSDPMGYGGVGWRFFNGAHEDQMGWLPANQIADVGGSGTSTHVISKLTEDPALAPYPQVLRIAKADSGDYYYLTYRVREGYDANLNSTHPDRTNVHRYAGSGYNNTLFIKALADTETFEDGVNGVVVTQLSHDADTATVQISTDCAAQAPNVALAPATQAGAPGNALAYTATVTNNDPGSCDASTFDLSASGPVGWTTDLSSSSMTLAPGQQGQATLTATSPVGELDGSYTVSVDANNPIESTHQASGDATYQVDGTPPDAIADLAAEIKRKTQVRLTWSPPFDAGSGVDAYDVYRDGALIGSTTTNSYTDRDTSSGSTYVYHVTAFDGLGNESAASNPAEITVGGSGGGGKGGGDKGGGNNKEVCDDGVDNDGDGQIDCADSNCSRNRVCR